MPVCKVVQPFLINVPVFWGKEMSDFVHALIVTCMLRMCKLIVGCAVPDKMGNKSFGMVCPARTISEVPLPDCAALHPDYSAIDWLRQRSLIHPQSVPA